MIDRILAWLVEWWMRNCKHAPEHVTADVLEGDHAHLRVQHCRRCGSVRVIARRPARLALPGEWRRAYPTDCLRASREPSE